MRMYIILSLMILGILPIAAQLIGPISDYNTSVRLPNSLTMSHSFGFNASSSSDGNGMYYSRYTNHLNWKLHSKLSLDLDLNFVNFGTASIRNKLSLNNDNSSKIFPDFSLKYTPSKNVSVEFKYSHVYNGLRHISLYPNPAR